MDFLMGLKDINDCDASVSSVHTVLPLTALITIMDDVIGYVQAEDASPK